MKTHLFTLTLLVVVLTGCKKNYTCACGNMNSTERTPVFEVKDTKKNAKQKCTDYLNSHAVIPEWTCEIR